MKTITVHADYNQANESGELSSLGLAVLFFKYAL